MRAIGPPTEVVSHWLSVGHSGTRPRVGRSPTTPQNDAGLRSEPPMSEPSASGTMPGGQRARRAAATSRRPSGSGRPGCSVVPKTVLKVCDPAANSGTLVLPIDDHAGAADPLDEQLVALGHVVGEQRRAVRRPPPRDGVGVLERERQPVQGPDLGAVGQRLVGGRRARPRALLVEADDRVELGVALGDPGQVQVEQLAGGDLLAAYRVAWSRAVESTVRSLTSLLPLSSDSCASTLQRPSAGFTG